jgi:hypothetical protein
MESETKSEQSRKRTHVLRVYERKRVKERCGQSTFIIQVKLIEEKFASLSHSLYGAIG